MAGTEEGTVVGTYGCIVAGIDWDIGPYTPVVIVCDTDEALGIILRLFFTHEKFSDNCPRPVSIYPCRGKGGHCGIALRCELCYRNC